MNQFFEFVTTKSSGLAARGKVQAGAGSLVNTARFLVEPGRFNEGTIEPGHSIQSWMVTMGGYGRFQCFEGVVTKIYRDGSFFALECVTTGAYAAVDKAPVQSWENATAKSVLADLLSSSRIPIDTVTWPASLSDHFLHTWNTHGGSVADEIAQLLRATVPEIEVFGSLDGRTIIGRREDVAKMFPALPYPYDEALGEADDQVTKFPPRPAYPGQLAYDKEGKFFLGTVDLVCHIIEAQGAYTEILLNDAPSVELNIDPDSFIPDLESVQE